MSKSLLQSTVRHVCIHNKVKEEELCWRQYKRLTEQRSRRYEAYRKLRNRPSLSDRLDDSAERELRRERKRKLEESADCLRGSSATLNFCSPAFADIGSGIIADKRWGHDGFEELEVPPASYARSRRATVDISSSSSSQDSLPVSPKRWGHDGFEELEVPIASFVRSRRENVDVPSTSSLRDSLPLSPKRWGHDGFDELELPGPLPPAFYARQTDISPPVSRPLASLSVLSTQVRPTNTKRCLEKEEKDTVSSFKKCSKHKLQKKKNKKTKKRSRSNKNSVEDNTTSESADEVEWIER